LLWLLLLLGLVVTHLTDQVGKHVVAARVVLVHLWTLHRACVVTNHRHLCLQVLVLRWRLLLLPLWLSWTLELLHELGLMNVVHVGTSSKVLLLSRALTFVKCLLLLLEHLVLLILVHLLLLVWLLPVGLLREIVESAGS
jgi:hypothetical protein